MTDQHDWRPRPTVNAVQLPLPLPPVPGVRRLRGDVCPRCHAIHTTNAEALSCRQANAQHEQY